MKKTILLTSIIAIAIVRMLSSCVDSEKDLYDPSYQTANPMGDGFAAPDGFDWNMTTTSILSIEIDDELYNQIEILDANPFSTSDYHILAKGVSKKGQAFSQEINYTEGTNYLYIRKTDSRSRVSISTWDVSKNKEIVGSRTTRVAKATTGSYNIPEKYPEETYDTTGAIELRGNTNWNQSNHHLEAGKSYIIKDKFNGEINHTSGYLNGGRFTIFVEGEWTPSQNQIQSADIIILKGGKINTDSFTSFLIADNSILTIQSGGSLIGNNINLAAIGVLLKNFVFKIIADSVLLQHIEHRIKRCRVGDDAQMIPAFFQLLQSLLDLRTKLAVIIGHFPHAGQPFRYLLQFFTVQIEVRHIILRPDFLRFFLQFVGFAPLFVGTDTAVQLVPEGNVIAACTQIMFIEERPQLPGNRVNRLIIIPDILERSSHIK